MKVVEMARDWPRSSAVERMTCIAISLDMHVAFMILIHPESRSCIYRTHFLLKVSSDSPPGGGGTGALLVQMHLSYALQYGQRRTSPQHGNTLFFCYSHPSVRTIFFNPIRLQYPFTFIHHFLYLVSAHSFMHHFLYLVSVHYDLHFIAMSKANIILVRRFPQYASSRVGS
jgi:hypothetical protein